jgi:tetratricopeptide (TPR) repeat protein
MFVSAWLLSSAFPAPAAAQFSVGRLTGTVRDIAGRPVKGASIRAVNPNAIPSEFAATSDRKGEWAILGPRSGSWEVSASSPDFETETVRIPVAMLQPTPPVFFVLVGVPAHGPLDGVDTKQLQADLAAAESLMAQERWDEAAAAYRAVLARVPSLDSVNLAIGRALRMKKDFAGAEAAYGELLRHDEKNQKALLELGRTQRERGDSASATATLERLVAIDPSTDEAALAREWLAAIR